MTASILSSPSLWRLSMLTVALGLLLSSSDAAAMRVPQRVSEVMRKLSVVMRHQPIGTPGEGRGVNFDICDTDDQCLGDRECFLGTVDAEDGDSCPEGGGPPEQPCFCVPMDAPICISDSACDEGESCVVRTSPDAVPAPFCYSDTQISKEPSAFAEPFPMEPEDPKETEDGGGETEDGGGETEDGGGEAEKGGGEAEKGGGEAEKGGGETEDGGGETEDGGGETEDGGGETEDGGGETEEAACFPGSAMMYVSDGSVVKMDRLSAGDVVKQDEFGGSSAIYMFTHRLAGKVHWFTRMQTESGDTLTTTARHYVHTRSGVKAAGAMQVGDEVRTIHGIKRVTAVKRVRAHGLYAPHSLHGDLVVDGFVVSGYSQAVHPVVAHALLAPLRWLVVHGGVREPLGALLYGGAGGLHRMLPSGSQEHRV